MLSCLMCNDANIDQPDIGLVQTHVAIGVNAYGFYTITLQETLTSSASLVDKRWNVAAVQQNLATSSVKASGHLRADSF